jgi:hypothetical protein
MLPDRTIAAFRIQFPASAAKPSGKLSANSQTTSGNQSGSSPHLAANYLVIIRLWFRYHSIIIWETYWKPGAGYSSMQRLHDFQHQYPAAFHPIS